MACAHTLSLKHLGNSARLQPALRTMRHIVEKPELPDIQCKLELEARSFVSAIAGAMSSITTRETPAMRIQRLTRCT